MHTKNSFRQTLFAISVLSLTGSALWYHLTEEPEIPAVARMHAEKPQLAFESVPLADDTPDVSPKSETLPIALTGTSWTVKTDEGTYTMALDEAMLRAADGSESVVRLTPPATQKTLQARLAELAAQHSASAWPVVYPAEGPRDEAHRRWVTPDLRVRVDASEAAAFAKRHQLSVKNLPDYAPGWAVLAAADPFAALAAVERLRAAGFVTADVLLAAQRQKRVMPNDTLINNQWHLKNSNSTRTHINVENAWNYGGNGVKGTGIRIGIVDDGLQTAHPDLSANVDTDNDRDWNGNDSDPNPGAGDDHGTACAGNAAARGNNNLGVSGSAPEATLVGLRLIAGSVTDAQEAEAMAWKNEIIHLKSNSWGPSDTGTILEAPGSLAKAALQTAVTTGRDGKGTLFFWAGGNGGDVGDNSNYDGYANSIYTIAIGASDSAGNRAYYSEPGANLVVCAPSSGTTGTLEITTTDRTGSAGYSSGDYANDFGGTSSATPTAAGVAALMLEKNPNLGWRDVQEILIRSAFRVKPADAGWTANSAGFRFNHNFGAGLIDATAAVNLATGWTNLDTQQSVASTQSGLSLAIPDNNANGITRTFDLGTSNLRIEHVTVRLSASHTYRGDLEIILTSPSGMTSRLAEKHADSNNNISNWTYSSVRHWGELSTGTWTLKIADRSSGDTGTLTVAELTVYGTPAAPVNTPPLVRITSPASGAVFSPGATIPVAVDASDLDLAGNPGVITQVELLQNDIVVGTDTTAPYEFAISPANGSHTLVARATDSEAAVGVSSSVVIEVRNQAPVITAAILSAGSQAFADDGLSVIEVLASDPEEAPLTTSYQWQASSDGRTYQNVDGATAATLSAAPELAGKLWRCVVTVSDSEISSSPFTTSTCNVINRPPATAEIGTAFNYDSGLLLRGGGEAPGRPAIIHEFSQGPVGSTSEWIEILTLQSTNLANWKVQDAGGTSLLFKDDIIWNDIPAGTLIVLYNGASKDLLLPADDLDPADGRMIVASDNATYFNTTSGSWPSLSNTGDAIFLKDATSNLIHQLAYGTSTAATPNIGSAASGSAAYFNGTSDEQANLAASWTVTSSLSARQTKALLPGVVLSGGNYSQNFDSLPGAAGTTYPDGWSSYSGATEDTAMTLGSPTSTTGANYNYGSRIGLLGSGSAFDPGSIVLAIQNTTGYSNLNIAYDVVKIREQGRTVAFKLQYSLTSATTGFIDISGGNYDSGASAENTNTPFTLTLPEELNDHPGTIYLRWFYSSSGSGSRDGLALDNVVISTGTITPALTLAVSPASFSENAGSNVASGTVSMAAALAEDLTVTLSNPDPSEIGIPASLIIPAGQLSASFTVSAVDDALTDGAQGVTITASAAGYTDGTFTLTVTDDEAPLTGVTPGAANTADNAQFIADLRGGALGNPAQFRLGDGNTLPDGLTLDLNSGLLSGVPSASNPPGDYPIIIESFNSLGETGFVSFSLTLTGGGNDYAAWIASYQPQLAGLTGRNDDPDHDGLPNAVENLLGSSPAVSNAGLTNVSTTAGTLVFYHTRNATPASDVTAAYEWSADLLGWHDAGASAGGVTVEIIAEVVTDDAHPGGWIGVTATTTAGQPGRLFVRLAAR